MGFDLGGLGKLLDPGAMAHQLVDSFLPKDMQWVGGLVGAAVDYQSGNVQGAISQGLSALSDLKDRPQSASQTLASNAPNAAVSKQNWNYEPSPPPARSTSVTTTTTTSSSTNSKTPSTEGADRFRATAEQLKGDASQASTKKTTKKTTTTTTTTNTSKPTPDLKAALAGGFSSAVHALADQVKNASQPSATSTTTTSTTSSSPPASFFSKLHVAHMQDQKSTTQSSTTTTTTTTSTGPSQADASGQAPPTSASSAPPASSASASKASDSASSGGSSDGVKKLLAMSNDDLQRAVANGNIPKDLSNSDMLALQTRMNQISQMNQLMTQMISAMHDMQMAVARNIHA